MTKKVSIILCIVLAIILFALLMCERGNPAGGTDFISNLFSMAANLL